MDDLPATQAMDGYDDYVETQKLSDDDEEDTLVGTLRIGDKSYSIVSGITTIGRHPDSKIHTNHETVSKHHAIIEASGASNSIFIKDLNSSNRTKLNNSRLKANCLYQIKDGDVLTFGQVIAIFKVYSTLEDSVAPCTPQVKQEVKPVIPSTPDSPLDASYNSEGDVSAIPGTQTDDIDSCFRRPRAPGRASMANDSIKLNLSDLPSPSSKSQSRQDELNQADTHRMSSSGSRDDLEEDMFDLETQKPVSNESNDSNENLLEMETQRPSDEVYNLETQRFSSRRSEVVRKSENSPLPIASTRKSVRADESHGDMNECETQRFNVHDGSCLEKCNISSARHVKTPSGTPGKSNDDGISDLETQSYDLDGSISSSRMEPGQEGTGQIPHDSNVIQDESMYNHETQRLGDERILSKHRTSGESVYDLVAQKDVPEDLFDEDFDNIETQRFDTNNSTLDNRKSINLSIYDAQTQPNTPVNSGRLSKFIETRKSNYENTKTDSCQSADVSIYSAETQKITPEATHDAAISDVETQRFGSEQGEDQGDVSFENLETQAFDTSKSCPLAEKSICESLHDVETQRLSSSPVTSMRNSSARVTDSKRSDIFRTPLPSPAPKRSIKPTHHPEPVKRESDISDCEAVQAMDDLETQKFDTEYRNSLSTGNVPIGEVSRESLQMSGNELDDVADQLMEDLETQKFCSRESTDSSLALIECKPGVGTAKFANQSQNQPHHEPIQEVETQKFSNNDEEDLFSHASIPRKSAGPMQRQSDLMTVSSRQIMSQSIQDLETQSFVVEEPKEFSRPSLTRKSNIESQLTKSVSSERESSIKPASETSKLMDQSLDESGPQKSDDFESRKSVILSSDSRKSGLLKVETTDDDAIAQPNETLETRTTRASNLSSLDVSGRKSSNPPLTSQRNTMSTSNLEDDDYFADLETQEVDEKPSNAVIDETADDLDSQGISFSIQDMETMPFMNETLPVDRSLKNQTMTNSNLTDLMSNSERTNISVRNYGQEAHTPLKCESRTTETEFQDEKLQNTHLTRHADSEKNVTLDDDDEDMFLSQNLLEEGPIAHLDGGEEAGAETNVSGKLPNDHKSVDGSGLVQKLVDNVCEQNDSNDIDREGEDSETDEEGVFSCHLSKNDDSAHQPGDEGTEENCGPVKRGDLSRDDLGKGSNTDLSARESSIGSKLADDDSETDEEGIFTNSISGQATKENAPVNRVDTDDARALAGPGNDESDTDEDLFENDSINKSSNVASHRISDVTKDPAESETLEVSSKANVVSQGVDGFADTEILESSVAESIDRPLDTVDEVDEFIAPTQIVDNGKSQAVDSDDMYGAPTQIAQRLSSNERNMEECNNVNTRESQIMVLGECIDTLEPTQIIDKETNTVIGEEDIKEISNASKRSLEELEIGNSKRFRNSDMSPNTKVDLNSTVEKNLDQMFEGPEEKVPANESVLLTQQLANILESSQTESVPQVEQALMSPSPTLGSRRSRARTKSRRTLNEETNSAILKARPNLDDTVEKNLNEIFQNSVNSISEYETDGLMTQQLANILSSQDDNQSIDAESSDSHQVSATPSASTNRKSRSSVASRKSSAALCQRQSTSRRSAVLRHQLNGSKLEASVQEDVEAEKAAQECIVSESNDEHNVLERSLSEGEILKQSRKSISYRHATVGFLSDLSPITTSEKVGFAITEGRTFSSDSQSDGEDLQTVMKKRISLSLSKSVDLNSSMSSLSGKDERMGATSITQSTNSNTGNNEDQQIRQRNSERKVMKKRSLARGTCGFSSAHEPVDGSELVSAYSTESEDNQSPRKKVCMDDNLNMSPLKSKPSPSKARDSASDDDNENVDSDDEFLKNLPAPKVAGTAECPPTDSQLAAPSDHEDEVPIDSQPVVIPNQWKLYSAKRFDLIYRGNRGNENNDEDEDEAETNEDQQPAGKESRPATEDGSQESHQQKIQSIDELLAKIESESSRVSVGRKSLVRVSNSDSDATNENENPNSTSRNTRRQSLRKPRSLRRSSSKIDQSSLDQLESQESQNLVQTDVSDQDSSGEDDYEGAVRKYKPLPRLDINALLPKDDEDEDLNELKQMCVKMYVGPTGRNGRAASSPSLQAQKSQELSPILTSDRRRQQKRSGLPKLNSPIISRGRSSVGCKPTEKRVDDVADVEDSALKSNVVFQGSEADSARKSSSSASSTMTSRTSGLTNNLNKRSIAPQDAAQNQQPKRTKLTRDDELLKKLSVVISPLQEKLFHRKNIIAHKRIILKQSPASQLQKDKRAVSTPKALANVDARCDETCESNVRGQGRRAASGKRRKNENLDVPSNNSSKENLEVDDSNPVSGAKRTRTQTSKVQKSVKTIKDSKSDEKSPSQDAKRKRGRPRKDQSMMDSSLNSSNVEFDTKKAETSIQGAKKKLGRPRKDQSSKNGSTDQSNVQVDESEKSTQEIVKRKGRPRKESSRDVSSNDENIEIAQSSSKSKSNQAIENRIIQVSRVSCVSNRTRTRGTKVQNDELTTKSSKDDAILASIQPKRVRNQKQSKKTEEVSEKKNKTIYLDDDSDSEAEFTVSKDTKDVKSKEEKVNCAENTKTTSHRAKSTKSVEVGTSTRSTRGKRGVDSSLESKESQNFTVETKNKRIKSIVDSSESQESQEEMIPKGTRSRPAKGTKSSKSADSVKADSKVTKGKRGRPRNHSISSAHSENNDHDSVGQNHPVKEEKSQPVRQTRKRAASPVELIECSSEESQEVAGIMQKSVEKDNPNSKVRTGQVPRKHKRDPVASVNSTKHGLEDDFGFEKPSSRPKRGKTFDSSEKSSLARPATSNKNSESASSARPSRRKNVEQAASPSSVLSKQKLSSQDSHKIFYLGKQSKIRQIIKKLGGSETEDTTECTILVCDKVVKTFEFLCSLLRGIPIVSTKWLEDSNKMKSFVDWKDYVLEDHKAESEHGFNLHTSMEKARDHKILNGYTIFLTPTITEPTIPQLEELVTLCGGKPILKAPTRWSAKTLVIVEVGDSQSAKKYLMKAPKTVKVYSTELILTGILCQNIDLNEYKIIL